jgi:hypothetical protein
MGTAVSHWFTCFGAGYETGYTDEPRITLNVVEVESLEAKS